MTAEAAVAMVALSFVVYALIGVVGAYVTEMRCQDAAREGARAAARGDARDAVLGLARRAAPAGSSVAVAGEEEVTVTVRATASWLGGVFAIPVAGTATSRVEPSG